MKKFYFLILVFSTFVACRKSVSVEETAQQWVEFYYNSEFDKAKNLSTPITKNLIDTIATKLVDDDEIIAFEITQMACTVKADSAVCSYLYIDEEGEFNENVHLIRSENRWLVDEPLVLEALTDEEMEHFFDEYEELLIEQTQNTLENE